MPIHRYYEDDGREGLRLGPGSRPILQTARWLDITWSFDERAPLGRLTGFEVALINGTDPYDESTFVRAPTVVGPEVRRTVLSSAVSANLTGVRSAVRAVYGSAKSAWTVQGIGQVLSAEGLDLSTRQEAVDAYNAAIAAQADADAAIDLLDDFSSDGVLTPLEKKAVVREYNELTGERAGIEAQATAFAITTEKTTYTAAVNALTAYLGGLSPAWNSTTTSTTISRTVWNTNWSTVYAARQTLLNKIAAEAAKKADWSGVVGRPSDAALLNNLIDPSTWVPGTTGAQTGFTLNGSAAENMIDFGVGPYGTPEPLWKCGADAASDADGGWHAPVVAGFDHTKSYRFSYWVKASKTGAGAFYIGCSTSGQTSNLGGGVNGNPYFWSGSLPQANKWYLLVGYLHGSGYGGGSLGAGGVFDPVTGERIAIAGEFRNTVGATLQTHRAYMYYDTDATRFAWFARPRVDEVNGNEPSLIELMGSATVGATAAQAAAITAAQGAANDAAVDASNSLLLLGDIAADGKLTPNEKRDAIARRTDMLNEQAGIEAQASALGITAEATSYTSAIAALTSYLGGLSPAWNSTASTTTISRTVWNTNWAAVYTARQALLNKIYSVTRDRAASTDQSSLSFNPSMNLIAGDGRPAGAKATYGTTNAAVLSYQDSGKTVLKVHSGSDDSTGVCFSAFRVEVGCQYTIFARVKASAAYASGFYLRVAELDSELSAGNTNVGSIAGEAGVQVGDRWRNVGVENTAISTAWQEYSITYTPTASPAAKWASVMMLNWSGMAFGELHVDVVHVSSQATYGATSAQAAAIAAAQAAANDAAADSAAAQAELDDIAADGKLTPNEKRDAIARRTDMLNEQAGIEAQASALGITTQKTSYTSAISTLGSYLGGLSPAWNSTASTTTISRTVWNTNWAAVYTARQVLLNKIAEVAATMATWASVGGTGRPDDNATVGAAWGSNLTGRPTELTDGRVSAGLDSSGNLWDQRNMPQVNTGGGSTALGSGSPLTAADVGATARITIAAHSRQYGFGAVSLDAGSVSGLSFTTKYYVYYDDATYAGGAVSYYAATSINTAISGNGRVYLGAITTPANGGGGTTPPPEYCVAVDQWLTDSLLAEHCEAGSVIDTWVDGFETCGAPIRQAILKTAEPCVEIITQSGARVVVSTVSPVETFDHITVEAQCALGCLLGVLHGDTKTLTPEVVIEVRPAGVRDVMRISVGDISYAAGTDPLHRIITHNGAQKP